MDKTILISCATLRQELEMVMEKLHANYPVIWIDSGLHVWPDRLRDRLQAEIDGLDPAYGECRLLFGFCGNSLVGLKSGKRKLVFPKMSDCVSIFLGAQQERDRLGSSTYFFTEGYLEFEHTFISEHSIYKKRFGEERAKRITKKMMAHYKQIAVIDTGAFDVDHVKEKISHFAQELEIPVVVVKGNLDVIETLVSDENLSLDKNFLTVLPEGQVQFQDSLNLGKSQFQS